VPPFVTRGIVLDMTAVTGQNPVPAGTPFNKKEIDDALAKQGLQIKKGDVVLFHTGWQELASKDAKAFMAGEPGLGKEGAEYLVSKEVVAIGADQWGLEVIPFEKGVGVFEVHQILLPRSGTYILENMNTGPLVADKAWEFMFVLGHARIKGSHQPRRDPLAVSLPSVAVGWGGVGASLLDGRAMLGSWRARSAKLRFAARRLKPAPPALFGAVSAKGHAGKPCWEAIIGKASTMSAAFAGPGVIPPPALRGAGPLVRGFFCVAHVPDAPLLWKGATAAVGMMGGAGQRLGSGFTRFSHCRCTSPA
jgi:Putative cyclase